MTINTILSDVGGVLRNNYDITGDVKKRVNLPDDVFTPLWEKLIYEYGTGKISEQTLWDTFANEGGNQVSLKENILGTEFAKHSIVYPKVIALMKSLGDTGYQMAVLSDTIPNHIVVANKHGIYEPFGDNLFLSNEIGFRKPDPAAYQFALDTLGVKDPSSVLFIDDKLDNVEAARLLGMEVLQVSDDEDSTVEAITKRLSL